MRRFVLALAGILGCGLLSDVARAQAPVRSASAEALFAAGREAMAQKRYDEACQKFEASSQLDPAAGTIFNLANCNEQRGKLAAALLQFREASARMVLGDERIRVAEARALALETRVALVTMKLGHLAPAGSVVVLDSTAVAPQSLNVPLPIDSGDHLAIVRAEGRSDREYPIAVREGQRVVIELEAGDPKPVASAPAPVATRVATPPGDATPEAPRKPVPILGYVVGGVGVAALGTSLVTGIVALSKKSTVEEECPGTVCKSQKGVDAHDSAATLATVSDVSLALGVVGVGVGSYLVFFHSPGGTEAAAVPVPGGARFVLRGRL